MTSLYIFTIVFLFWCFSVFGHHPPFLHSFTLLRLPPSSWPCSQKGAHLIASRFRHTRWVSERIRWNGVHARTKREIEERQKEERDEGSTDTPIPQHPHLTAPEGCRVHTVRTAYKEKKTVSLCSTACHFPPESLSERWNHEKAHAPPTKPHLKTPHTKTTTLSMLASVLPMQACESYGWWMKPHLFVKGKAITLKGAVYVSNTQSTSRTIATLSKRWEALHAPVCPTDTVAWGNHETFQ